MAVSRVAGCRSRQSFTTSQAPVASSTASGAALIPASASTPAGEQRGEAEVAFVQPPAEHEQPRAERVALDAGDARDRSGRHGPIVQSAPLARLCVGVGIVLATPAAGLAPVLGARLP